MNKSEVLDESSRERKARKIYTLVNMFTRLKMGKMLEVGTGSGYIASFFSKLGYGADNTFAVDVVDSRQVESGFVFSKVEDVVLPFSNNTFDFAISNHVIEHVGGTDKQKTHLKEIFRCLEPGGVFYFAVPNRWRLIEPHFKLFFLSWFPRSISSKYVRLFTSYDEYDCKLLTRNEAISYLNEAGFEYIEATYDAIRVMGDVENTRIVKLVSRLPKFFWKAFSFFIPTHIFICHKPLD